MLRDRRVLRRQLQSDPHDREGLMAQMEKSLALARARAALAPTPTFPEHLPINARREEIARAIEKHPVIVLCGETGSGKTTQLPKICLSMGRGITGTIGITQPRRIAARSIAAFLARDLGCEAGQQVGFKVRFGDRTGAHTLIKLVTDGMMLAEMEGDRLLMEYDTLIIDEAHERSLNIDFLLGNVKRLLAHRPELKVIISSATIDTEKFSRHFHDAPIVEVSGRTYPVELRYRPIDELDEDVSEKDRLTAILAAVAELNELGPFGDILVFLPGEREIRETADALRKAPHAASREILPLFARLSAAEQERVFSPSSGKRRVVLATNVAETSLTVPGIRYVIDTGLARISRVAGRGQVQRLPVERISQSAADQRKGRCGRLSDGVCIRLYAQEDFDSRPRFTEPEILRANLASVILTMKHLGLGEVVDFPFIDPPHPKAVREGYRLLEELGALNEQGTLTPIGRQLARLPLDPRLGRMILSAKEKGCLVEVSIITAFLSVQDPRDRPLEKRQAADAAHQRFQDEKSDFASILSLWRFLASAEQEHKSHNKFRRFLKENYLSPVRVREWRDIHRQLKQLTHGMGFTDNSTPADGPLLHQALLSGLLGNIGMKSEEKGEYLGTWESRFLIHPSSGLAKKGPKWIMAAERVETTRLFARITAQVDPLWIEAVAGKLCKKSWFDPHWEKKASAVFAFERVTLFGLILEPRRKVHYGPMDPPLCRELFIRHGLIQGEYVTSAPFFQHNMRLMEEIRLLESKARRPDILVDETWLFSFFDQRLPEDVYDGRAFERFLRQQRNRNLLFLDREDLLRHSGHGVTEELFPGHLTVAGQTFSLEYHFSPGEEGDGINLLVPLAALNGLSPHPFEWLVPGLLEEKVTALMKGLPKGYRRFLVPLPDTAREVRALLTPGGTPLPEALSAVLHTLKKATIPPNAWLTEKIPPHLVMNFKIMEHGRMVGQGRDLSELKARFGSQAAETFRQGVGGAFARKGITRWDFGTLPEKVTRRHQGSTVVGYPLLLDEGDSVSLTLLDAENMKRHQDGLCRLFMLALPQQVNQLKKSLAAPTPQVLHGSAFETVKQFREAVIATAFAHTFIAGEAKAIRDQKAFEERLQRGRSAIVAAATALGRQCMEILALRAQVTHAMKQAHPPLDSGSRQELMAALDRLSGGNFLDHTPPAWFIHLPRFLQALLKRLEKRANNPLRDKQLALQAAARWKIHAARTDHDNPELANHRWMLEEWMVSLFAQELRTSIPVSEKRLDQQWEKVVGR